MRWLSRGEREEEGEEMRKYKIRYGLSGGFGGCGEWEKSLSTTLEEAEEEARQCAIELYESYEGLHGLRTVDEIMSDEDCDDEQEALEIYNEEVDSWLDYEAKEDKDEEGEEE